MRKTFFKIHAFSWAIATLIVCLIFTAVVSAETEKHQHSHEQEAEVKEAKDHAKYESHDQDSAHDEHGEEGHEEGNRKVGEGKAVVEIHDEKGFRLSTQAYVALGIDHQKVNGSLFKIPKSALVQIKNTTAVYRYHDHFFKLIPVNIQSEEENHYIVTAVIKVGELIVTQGVELLRVADVYAQDTSDYSHGH
ncbi:MAG TPA: hypothetical protein PKC21_01875 [Oligoflexia bacterium]|nr:hypothetical protein [bacterium]HMQ11355.1 hypothetical protein [Oligoflexia bacterium]HMR24079.1 hypothetical protein [Oligoflexia bacterium]